MRNEIYHTVLAVGVFLCTRCVLMVVIKLIGGQSLGQTGLKLSVLVSAQQVQRKTSTEQFEWRCSRAARPFVRPGPHALTSPDCVSVKQLVAKPRGRAGGRAGGGDKAAFHIPSVYLNIAAPACSFPPGRRSVPAALYHHRDTTNPTFLSR